MGAVMKNVDILACHKFYERLIYINWLVTHTHTKSNIPVTLPKFGSPIFLRYELFAVVHTVATLLFTVTI